MLAVARRAAGFLLDLYTHTGRGKKKTKPKQRCLLASRVCVFAICCCIQSIVRNVKEGLLVPSAD